MWYLQFSFLNETLEIKFGYLNYGTSNLRYIKLSLLIFGRVTVLITSHKCHYISVHSLTIKIGFMNLNQQTLALISLIDVY